MHGFLLSLSIAYNGSFLFPPTIVSAGYCLSGEKRRNFPLFCCFLEKNLYRSNVRFCCFLNVCSQFSFISTSVAVETTIYGYRSVNFFCPADTKDKNKMLTTFRAAACYSSCLSMHFVLVVLQLVFSIIHVQKLNVLRLLLPRR